MANKRDYYEVLGLSKGASKDEIKKSYRRLAKEFHPDRNKAPDAESKFKEVQEAYDILSDDEKRSAYDQYGFAGTQAFDAGGGFGGGFGEAFNAGDLGDLFGQFFGGGLGGFDFGGGGVRAYRGADIQINLKISFMDAVFGTTRQVNYKRHKKCEACAGTGAEKKEMKKCEACDGKGKVTQVQQTFFGKVQTVSVCPTCLGKGEVPKEKCHTCHGAGKIVDREEFEIKIPAGIPDGVSLRFEGKGEAGENGGPEGDLYINIEVESHPKLERRGDDIYLDQEIDVVTATLGGEVTVPSVHGDITVKVPPGTQPHKVIRLSGKGGPKFRGHGNGDQYMRVIVKIPEKLNREEQDAWEKLRKN